jgi:hypothetical protein
LHLFLQNHFFWRNNFWCLSRLVLPDKSLSDGYDRPGRLHYCTLHVTILRHFKLFLTILAPKINDFQFNQNHFEGAPEV